MAQPETLLWNKVKAALAQYNNINFIKVHGNEFMRSGEPDVLGCYEGRPFAIELKAGTGHPVSSLQIYRLEQWRKAGASVGVANSVETAIDIAINGNEHMERKDWWNG